MSESNPATCGVAVVAVGGLEVESQQRLGVRRAQVEPPRAAVDGEPVEAVLVEYVENSSLTSSMTAADVVDVGVDLAARRVALERLAQHRQVALDAADSSSMHEHRRDEPAVGAVVAGEVVVRRVLAAEDGAGLEPSSA